MAADVAPLARVPGIDPDHTATSSLSLVLQEAPQLRERPRVEPATGPGEIDDARDEGRVLVVAALRAFPETVRIMRDRRVS